MSSDSIVFDRAAGYYDETRGFPAGEATKIAAFIAQAGGLTAAQRVLEIGVGTGRIALPLAAHVGAYVGVDLSRPMMDRLREKQKTEPVYLSQADATRLPFSPGAFDAALAAHVFHLIPNWQDALRELARVLKPGAPLLHCWGARDPVFQALRDVMDAAMPPDQQPRLGVPRGEWSRFLQDEGWRQVGEIQAYRYVYRRVPQQFMEQLRGRVWSGTWRLSDEALAGVVAAVQSAIDAQFPNPQEPVEVSAAFNVGVYLPLVNH